MSTNNQKGSPFDRNQVENWYKLLQNYQMIDIGEKIDQL